MLSTYFLVWMLAVIFFWYVSRNHLGIDTTGANTVFKGIVLPLLLMMGTIIAAKNDYWGRGKWLCIAGAAITFLTRDHCIVLRHNRGEYLEKENSKNKLML